MVRKRPKRNKRYYNLFVPSTDGGESAVCYKIDLDQLDFGLLPIESFLDKLSTERTLLWQAQKEQDYEISVSPDLDGTELCYFKLHAERQSTIDDNAGDNSDAASSASEPTALVTQCHVCPGPVLTGYLTQHVRGETHLALVRLAIATLQRLNLGNQEIVKQLIREIDTANQPSEYNEKNPEVHYCLSCNVTIEKNSAKSHEREVSHKKMAARDRQLLELSRVYLQGPNDGIDVGSISVGDLASVRSNEDAGQRLQVTNSIKSKYDCGNSSSEFVYKSVNTLKVSYSDVLCGLKNRKEKDQETKSNVLIRDTKHGNGIENERNNKRIEANNAAANTGPNVGRKETYENINKALLEDDEDFKDFEFVKSKKTKKNKVNAKTPETNENNVPSSIESMALVTKDKVALSVLSRDMDEMTKQNKVPAHTKENSSNHALLKVKPNNDSTKVNDVKMKASTPIPEHFYHCKECQKTVPNSEFNITVHNNGKKHKKNFTLNHGNKLDTIESWKANASTKSVLTNNLMPQPNAANTVMPTTKQAGKKAVTQQQPQTNVPPKNEEKNSIPKMTDAKNSTPKMNEKKTSKTHMTAIINPSIQNGCVIEQTNEGKAFVSQTKIPKATGDEAKNLQIPSNPYGVIHKPFNPVMKPGDHGTGCKTIPDHVHDNIKEHTKTNEIIPSKHETHNRPVIQKRAESEYHGTGCETIPDHVHDNVKEHTKTKEMIPSKHETHNKPVVQKSAEREIKTNEPTHNIDLFKQNTQSPRTTQRDHSTKESTEMVPDYIYEICSLCNGKPELSDRHIQSVGHKETMIRFCIMTQELAMGNYDYTSAVFQAKQYDSNVKNKLFRKLKERLAMSHYMLIATDGVQLPINLFNWHGLRAIEYNLAYECMLCEQNFPGTIIDSKIHFLTTKHLEIICGETKNGIREIPGTVLFHCVVCNVLINNSADHIARRIHRDNHLKTTQTKTDHVIRYNFEKNTDNIGSPTNRRGQWFEMIKNMFVFGLVSWGILYFCSKPTAPPPEPPSFWDFLKIWKN